MKRGTLMRGFGTSLLLTASLHAKIIYDAPLFTDDRASGAVAAGDLDGDGDPDTVAALTDDGVILVRLNVSGGVLEQGQSVPVGADPQDVVLFDLDGDGPLDAVVACAGDDTVAVLRGVGDGTFGPATTYPTDGGPIAIAVANVDDDGAPDLIVLNATSETISVLKNAGDGTFLGAVNTFVGEEPSGIAAGDLDEDGLPDLAISRKLVDEASNGTVLVMLNDGAGGFVIDRSYSVIGRPNSPAIGDLTGDGIVDIAVASFQLGVLLNRGDADFGDGFVESNLFYPVGAHEHLSLDDLDGDGDLDVSLLSENSHNNVVSVVLNLGNTLSDPSRVDIEVAPAIGEGTSASVGWPGLAVDDFTGDGEADILASGYVDSDGHLLMLVNYGDAMFPEGLSYGVSTTVGLGGPNDVAFGDMNGDGALDIFTVNSATNDVTYLANDGDGTFGEPFFEGSMGPQPTIPPSTLVNGVNPVAIAAGNLDTVGGADVVVANQFSSSVSVLRNDDFETLLPGIPYTTGPLPSDVILADLDADDDLDAIVGHRVGTSVSILPNNGDATFGDVVPAITGSGPRSVAVADLDNDGDLDIAVVNALDETISILRNDGALVFATEATLPADAPFAIVTGDWDDNGVVDLAVLSESNSTVSILSNRGKASFDEPVVYPVRDGATALSSGDVDGDGRSEIVVANNDRTVSVFVKRGSAFQVVDHLTVVFETRAVGVADLDNDGILEIAATDGTLKRVAVIDALPGVEIDPCPADTNGSGAVGFDDVTIVLNAWGPCTGECRADVNDTGSVGFDDLIIVLNAWGPCPG